MSSAPSVAVLGASTNRSKYGNKSIRAHQAQGYDVYPVNPRATEIEGLTCYPTLGEVPVQQLTRITLYLPPAILLEQLPDIAAKGADEVWFNPGTDTPEVLQRARDLGIDPIVACSIVAIGVNPGGLSES